MLPRSGLDVGRGGLALGVVQVVDVVEGEAGRGRQVGVSWPCHVAGTPCACALVTSGCFCADQAHTGVLTPMN